MCEPGKHEGHSDKAEGIRNGKLGMLESMCAQSS